MKEVVIMHQRRLLKPFAMAAGMVVLACPTFSYGESGSNRSRSFQSTAVAQPTEPTAQQLPGSGEMKTTDRTGTTGPSGSRSFAVDTGAVDATARVAKPAGDFAATGTDRDLAARIRVVVEGDPALAPLIDNSFHIAVDNGAVTLQGKVKNALAKEQINAKVKATAGSHPVDNKLVIAQQ
jgi:hypothetical protein